MKVCKRSIITSSLLAILAISSAYGATPVQPSESTDAAVIEIDYSNIPELKKSIESTTPAIVQSTLDASKGKPTNGKPIYSTVTMSGNRVVSVKTYKTKEEQEKAMLKERKRLDKVTAERQAKRKDETRTDMLKKDENKAFSIDVNAYFINPTTHTISISRSEDAKGIDIKKEERAEAVFKLPSHQLQAGDPQYEIAKLMYQDLTNKKFD